MITLADAVQSLSLPVVDTQSPQASTEDFGQLLFEVQDAPSAAEEQTPEAFQALESVLQTLAHILQPLTYSITTAAFKPQLPLEQGEAEPESAPAVRASEAPQEEAAPGAVQATLAALLAVHGTLRTAITPLPQAPNFGTPAPEMHYAGDVAPSLLSATRVPPLSPALDGTFPESVSPVLAGADRPPQIGNSVAFFAASQALAEDRLPVATLSPQDALSTSPAVPPLSRFALPEQWPTAPEGLPDVQPATAARARTPDMPEDASEQTLSAIPGTPEARLFSGVNAAPGSTAPGQQAHPSPASAPDGLPLSQSWRLPSSTNTVLLHIDPPELGPLLVHIRLHDKRLSASFQVESPDVEAILRANLPALHASLSQHGFEVQPIVLSLATEGFSSALSNGAGHFSQQQSTFHAFIQEQTGADSDQRRSDPESGRLFPEPRPYKRRLIDVLI